MKRLYYLTKSITCAENISDKLHSNGVNDWNFHVMSKNRNELDKHHLHKASFFFHEHDGFRMAERGAIIGLICGVFAMIGFVVATPNIAPEYHWIAMAPLGFVTLILVAFGVGFGAIYGLDHENVKVKRFHNQLEHGEYLIMIDVKKEQAESIKQLLSAYREANIAGEGDTFVNPFYATA